MSRNNSHAPESGEIQKYVYSFGKETDGDASMRALLGGKGANLAEMAKIKLPVPAGFTLTTEVCDYYYKHQLQYPKGLEAAVHAAIQRVEAEAQKRFGDPQDPLLFSVRSGARDSMPGMMDTILNLGLNDQTVESLAKKTDNPRFAYDCYRRFIQMYGDVVMGVQAEQENDHDPFDGLLEQLKNDLKVHNDTDLEAKDWQTLITQYKALIQKRTGRLFPQDVYEQLWGSISAVFSSWNNERAVIYRQKYGIPSEWGTAVNVQRMVFGNKGPACATGVAFTRDPANGQKVLYGEYLINAQGEDVVAGTRTPNPIADMATQMPKAYAELKAVQVTLEKHFRDMQDFEFTIEEGHLYMLQTRNGKRTGLAAIRIAVEMEAEGLISQKEALKKIPADSITSLLVPIFDRASREKTPVIAKGLPAGPGAASGHIVFAASTAEKLVAQGKKVVLCRIETSPEDLKGMIAAEGILTARGGVSSHAALVARQMGKICVCGAKDLVIDYHQKTLSVGGFLIKEGDFVSIDGSTGEVFAGAIASAPSEVTQVIDGLLAPEKSATYGLFAKVMSWADTFRRLGIRTNADTPEQAKRALALGAEGIGLCRTEHMFFEGNRIDFVREKILATTPQDRLAAIQKLMPFQRQDFVDIFRVMKGYPVTIRLLDPPLHEFLPQDQAAIEHTAKHLKVSVEHIQKRIAALHETNPMLGHRGCRLGIVYPELTEMQARAIFEAAAIVAKEGHAIPVEVMVPLVGYLGEYKHQAAIVHKVAQEVSAQNNITLNYRVGTMIELPRAALLADQIAQEASFFSFGTNDLTQTTLGMSRDDAGTFLPHYSAMELIGQDPFASLDQEGVGQLITLAVERGRKTRPDIKLGICGEHGGDPASITFFHKAGLDYVSCSPPRVPVARLAAAQAAL